MERYNLLADVSWYFFYLASRYNFMCSFKWHSWFAVVVVVVVAVQEQFINLFSCLFGVATDAFQSRCKNIGNILSSFNCYIILDWIGCTNLLRRHKCIIYFFLFRVPIKILLRTKYQIFIHFFSGLHRTPDTIP